MTHAYSELYLNDAMESMAGMLDYAANYLEMDLREFYSLFLNSKDSNLFAKGNVRTISGMSGIELAAKVLHDSGYSDHTPLPAAASPYVYFHRSPEFWAGWALAYYQWYSRLTFQEIEEFLPVTRIVEHVPSLP